MMYVVRVIIVPRDRTGAVDAPNDGALLERCTGTRRIERGERAVRGPQKAMVRGARVCVGSRDRTGVVNTRRRGSFDAARRVERGQCAVRGPQKAVRQKIVVVVVPGNRSAPVDAQRDSPS